ncbi:unnamed protein product, partial [Meganyctiphanes norvegica]
METTKGLKTKIFSLKAPRTQNPKIKRFNFFRTMKIGVSVHKPNGFLDHISVRVDHGAQLVYRRPILAFYEKRLSEDSELFSHFVHLEKLIKDLFSLMIELKEKVFLKDKSLIELIETTGSDNKVLTIVNKRGILHPGMYIGQQAQDAFHCHGQNAFAILHCINEINCGIGSLVAKKMSSKQNFSTLLFAGNYRGAQRPDQFSNTVQYIYNYILHTRQSILRPQVFQRHRSVIPDSMSSTSWDSSTLYPSNLVLGLTSRETADLAKKSHDVISESALRSDPRGLPGMYNNTLAAVNTVCQPLLAVTSEHGSDAVRGYSFLEQSAWPEVALALETETQHIFNPGNPQTFHQVYLETIEFLESFEKLLGTREKINKYREMPEYTNFMDRWNLPVYFQIRYGEIGQVVECALSGEGCGLTPSSGSSQFSLQCTQVLWDNLQRCYDPSIFLQPLLHRFWKLSLLLLSRYRTWVETTTKTIKDRTHSDKLYSNVTLSLRKSLNPAKPKETQVLDKSAEKSNVNLSPKKDAAVCLVHDIQMLADTIPTLYSVSIESHVSHLPEDKLGILKGEFQQQKVKLTQLINGVSEVIIEVLTTSANAPLRQVSDTPRLYRRTNRASPTSHQPYIAAASATLTNFFTQHAGLVDEEMMAGWFTRICSVVSEHYKSVTYDVLSSVHKMEESLKRLKRARDRGAQGTGEASTGLSDDDKIRLQIALDVEYFGEQIKILQVDPNSIESYSSLLNMVTSAKEGKFVQ